MFQPEHMPQFVEYDPLDIDSRQGSQSRFTRAQGTGIGVPTEIGIQHYIGLHQEEVPCSLYIALAGDRHRIAEAISTMIGRKRDRIDPIALLTGVGLCSVHRKKVGHDRIPQG